MKKKIIVITGPTASGKTEVAFRLASHFQTEIISADSRQIYQELNIGVARPPQSYLNRIPHHFIATHSIHEPVSAGKYALECRNKITELLKKNSVIIMTGGTGFYFKAVFESLEDFPLKNPATRDKYNKICSEHTILYLQKLLKEKSEKWYSQIDINNAARIRRVLEILEEYPDALPGTSKNTWIPNADVLWYGLLPDRTTLYLRINHRVDEMLKQGLKEEAMNLQMYSDLPPLRTVGYREWYENKNLSDEYIIEKIKQNTRHYAKRQITWFRNQIPTIRFITHHDTDTITGSILSEAE